MEGIKGMAERNVAKEGWREGRVEGKKEGRNE